MELDVIVAGAQARIHVYAIPRELKLSYGLMLSQRWMRQVRMRGNDELDKYYIRDPENGKYREVQRNTITNVNAVELQKVRLTEGEPGTEKSMDDETRDELELAGAYKKRGGDEILQELIGQATNVMRRQSQGDGITDLEDSESDLGNGSGYIAIWKWMVSVL
jgi:hypothetical protein